MRRTNLGCWLFFTVVPLFRVWFLSLFNLLATFTINFGLFGCRLVDGTGKPHLIPHTSYTASTTFFPQEGSTKCQIYEINHSVFHQASESVLETSHHWTMSSRFPSVILLSPCVSISTDSRYLCVSSPSDTIIYVLQSVSVTNNCMHNMFL